MSLYQMRAQQGPHIKTYLISWQLFGPKISLEIHCWPITTFFKTVGENFSQCQIVLFCMMVSNCPILHDGVKLSSVSNCPRCQIVLFAFMVSNCPTCHYGVKLSSVLNCPRCQIVLGVKWSQDPSFQYCTCLKSGQARLKSRRPTVKNVDCWTEKLSPVF